MVLIRGKRAGLAAALDGLQGGLQAGFGMGQQMRRTQLAEREQAAQEERYRQSVQLASQAAALDAQREKRYADEQDRNNKLQDEQRAGARALIDSRIEGITPEQTAPGAPPIDGIGPKSLSKFGAGLMQHHDRVLSHAKSVAAKLPPEMHEKFWGDVQRGLQRDQQDATVAKLKSDLEGFGNDANTELGGGPVQDLMGEAGDGQAKKGSGALGRFSEIRALLDSASDPNMDPEQRQKIITTAAQGIGQTHDLLNREELRREEVASTVAQYQQAFAAEEQGLAALGKSPEAMVLRERLKAKKLALIQYKRDRDFDLQKALSDADDITLPTARTGTGGGGESDIKSRELDARIRKDATERADKLFAEEQKKDKDDPTRLPWESIYAKEYLRLGGQGDRAPEQGAGAPGPGGSPNPVAAPGGALEKTLFDPAPWKKEVQKLAESGNDIDARALFLKNNPQLKKKKLSEEEATRKAVEQTMYDSRNTVRGGM